jgi:hypothetical protein
LLIASLVYLLGVSWTASKLKMADHGGTDNGKLPVTYDDFERYGIHRHAIGPAIREVVALGFVEITEAGRAGNAEWRKPNLFRLTYRQTKYEPTNDWDKIKTPEEAEAMARSARENKTQWRKPPVFGGGKRHHTGEIQGTENTTTSDGPEIATTLDISGRGGSSSGRAVSPGKSARPRDGRLAEAKIEAKHERPLGNGVSKQSGKNREQARNGNAR